jgi:hypothetical protein
MNINNTKNRVLHLLTQYPKLRDNDNTLTGYVWHYELEEMGVKSKEISAIEFFVQLSQGNLTSGEAITRARRKLQEENAHLRGQKYAERHNHQEAVKEQLGYAQTNLFR